MDLEESVGIMALLDEVRRQVGVRYAADEQADQEDGLEAPPAVP
jgi:hypothetical protein